MNKKYWQRKQNTNNLKLKDKYAVANIDCIFPPKSNRMNNKRVPCSPSTNEATNTKWLTFREEINFIKAKRGKRGEGKGSKSINLSGAQKIREKVRV